MFISFKKKGDSEEKEEKQKEKKPKKEKKTRKGKKDETPEEVPSSDELSEDMPPMDGESPGEGPESGELSDDDVFSSLDGDIGGDSKGSGGGFDQGKVTELDIKITDVDKKVDKTDAYVKATRSDMDEMKKKIDGLDSNIQKLLTIYDEFTKKINPFSGSGGSDYGGEQVIEELPMSLAKTTVVPAKDDPGLDDIEDLIPETPDGEFLQYRVPEPPSPELVNKMTVNNKAGAAPVAPGSDDPTQPISDEALLSQLTDDESADDSVQKLQAEEESIHQNPPNPELLVPTAAAQSAAAAPAAVTPAAVMPDPAPQPVADAVPPAADADGGADMEEDDDGPSEMYMDVIENLKLTLTLLIAEMRRKGIDVDVIEGILEE